MYRKSLRWMARRMAEFLCKPQVLVTIVATVDAADQARTVCVLPLSPQEAERALRIVRCGDQRSPQPVSRTHVRSLRAVP